MIAQVSTSKIKSKKQKKGVPVRVHVPDQLDEKIEIYRAEQRVKGTIISSKEKAILHLTEIGLSNQK